jgi:ferredoxin-NADP reductase
MNVRRYKVVRRVEETPNAVSIYLSAADDLPLQPFRAGQYLMLRIPEVGERAYVLSAFSAQPKTYRVTVALNGRPDVSGSHASTYWHNAVAIGDVLEAVGPVGSFHLPDRLDRPFAVISAGIGEAPMTAIAEELAVRAPRHRAWFLHGTTNGATFALKSKLGFLRSDLPNSQWRIWYSRPRSSDRQDRDYNILGQLDLGIFDQLQPTNEFDFYACGPDEFVASTTTSLRKLGIPGSRIKTEALGRAGEVDLEVVGEDIDVAPLEPRTINFIRSGKRATWTPNHGSILEFAEYLGLTAAFSCRTGMCGKCAQRIVSGRVIPIRKTHAIPCEGHQLMCSNVPDSDLVIDL